MNIKEIISTTHKYNFHAHTQFCDGRNTVAEMAESAVSAGFVHFGFSPHSPVAIESPCNMAASDIDAYRAEVEKTNNLYGDRCRFYTGMEIDYLGSLGGPASPEYRDYGLDYAIGSVHFIRCQDGRYVDIDGHFDSFNRKMSAYFRSDIRYVVEEFYNASAEMLAAGGFDILGHFDKIGLNASCYCPGIEDQGWYTDLVDSYIDEIISSGKIVEINTKARKEHGRFFPGERYWKRLVDAGVPLAVNSDAHYRDRLDAFRDEAFSILDTLHG